MARPFGIFRRFKAWSILMLLLWIPSEAMACRLALVLAMDVSKSVDSREFDLQVVGLANALKDQSVRTAIFAQGGPVAAAAFLWSGEKRNSIIADWLVFTEPSDVDQFATQIERYQRKDFGGRTAIGTALVFARDLLLQGPDCMRRVIDVSGDGYNNDGIQPPDVYKDGGFKDITVNALVIGGLARPKLRQHFESEVIHGPGSFVLATQDFTDYAEAIRSKLLRELRERNVIASARGR